MQCRKKHQTALPNAGSTPPHFPQQCVRIQICGSFMIINGTIHAAAATATGVPVTPVEADIPPAQASRQDGVR